MSEVTGLGQVQQSDPLLTVSRTIDTVTSLLPISQLVVPLAGALDWLLDEGVLDQLWQEQRRSFQARFAERWRAVAVRALGENPRLVSDEVLHSADHDLLGGAQPWGVELTRAFRAALAEMKPVVGEVTGVLPASGKMRAFARAMSVHSSSLILPVISYSPLLEGEWQTVLDNLNEIVELALGFEGAALVWMIGGFYRDVNGRLLLKPQIALPPPQTGTRVKPLYVLLGTAYEEQCPSLIPYVQRTWPRQSHLSANLIRQTPWHRVVVQLSIPADDFELFGLSRLGETEREISRKVMYLDQQPRLQHVVTGTAHEVPRPYVYPETPVAEPVRTPPANTNHLPSRPAVETTLEPGELGMTTPGLLGANLHDDAEELRRKGMWFMDSDPPLAQKYLLASTVLENTSVDVWLKLVDLATNPKQKEAFRREAEKALRRQQPNS
jgi:hypothetical protein